MRLHEPRLYYDLLDAVRGCVQPARPHGWTVGDRRGALAENRASALTLSAAVAKLDRSNLVKPQAVMSMATDDDVLECIMEELEAQKSGVLSASTSILWRISLMMMARLLSASQWLSCNPAGISVNQHGTLRARAPYRGVVLQLEVVCHTMSAHDFGIKEERAQAHSVYLTTIQASSTSAPDSESGRRRPLRRSRPGVM